MWAATVKYAREKSPMTGCGRHTTITLKVSILFAIIGIEITLDL